ncbi:GDSL esterase/lipase At5g45670-like [Salvia miltiorrhiza]|uniref:GDSL esterase/lipase At5g45670-like n=1 Tax=Salvia miltiorrhiza TaxID=226208 RepID=UPI0025AB9E37|nr:GDSL esterase/lipase At5g45670-like [Salvia miltiorrhiza]
MAKIIFTIFLFLVASNLVPSIYGEKLVPCYFIFGDSLLDNGNNNHRNTVAKANFLPYGIDYPNGQTGRFSNGRNVADFIAEELGFPAHIPPFATASGDDDAVLNGVNYASGGAGILSGTGKQLGDVISLDEQLQNHQTTINRSISILGNADAAKNHMGHCIYSVGMGSNDYAAYAMNPLRPSPNRYASQLIDNYSRQLRDLYAYGARKVSLFGLGAIGCVPAARLMYGRTLCLSATKTTSGVFNTKLKSLVDVLNKDLVGANFTYIDTFGITVSDPASNGFKYDKVECCTVSAAGMCVPQGVTCSNRTDYAYFDGYHPTEAAAAVVAKRAFAALSPSDAYPFDIQHLAQA